QDSQQLRKYQNVPPAVLGDSRVASRRPRRNSRRRVLIVPRYRQPESKVTTRAFAVTNSEWPSSWWPKRIVHLRHFKHGARNQATGLPVRIAPKNGVPCCCTHSAA